MTLTFAKSSIAYGHFRGLIFKKKQEMDQKTRHQEFYQVTKAPTERFRNSPFITMQRLLNEDKKKKNISKACCDL